MATDAPVVDVVALTAFESQGDSSKHVAYLDRDGHIHDLRLGPSGTWTYLDLTQELDAPIAAGTALAGYGVYTPARLAIAFVDGYGHVQACRSQPASRGGAVIASPGSAAQANEERAAVAG